MRFDLGSEGLQYWKQKQQHNEKAVCKCVNFRPQLTQESNMLFNSLKCKGFVTEKKFKYFRFRFKKNFLLSLRRCNLEKFYMLSKIHLWLSIAYGRPVSANSRALARKNVLIFRQSFTNHNG